MESYLHLENFSTRFTRCGSVEDVLESSNTPMPTLGLFESDGWGIALIMQGQIISSSLESEENFEDARNHLIDRFRQMGGNLTY